MTTTTKPKSPSAELRKLEQARENAHEKVLELKEKLAGWDTEDLPPEVRPGSAQADLHATLRERDHGRNPHRDQYEAALETFTALDAELQAFKRASATDRIAEVVDGGDYGIRGALASLRDGLEAARSDKEEVLGIIFDTPGLNGQDLVYDGRLDEWTAFVRDALRGLDEGELVTPGLTEAAAWKLANDG